MDAIVDVPFGVLDAVNMDDDILNEPAVRKFREQFEKDVRTMYCDDVEMDNDGHVKRAGSTIVERKRALRIKNCLKGAKETAKFRQLVKLGKYRITEIPAGSGEDVLVREVKLEDDNSGKDTGPLGLRRVAVLEDFFDIIIPCHVVDGKHLGMQRTWKAVLDQYTNITRTVVRKFVELCPTCQDKRALGIPSSPLQKSRSPNSGNQEHIDVQKNTTVGTINRRSTRKRKIQGGQNGSNNGQTSTINTCHPKSTTFTQQASGFKFSKSPSLEEIRAMQKKFIVERDWDQFHAPRNVLLAMVGEVGEVAELFQWRGEVKEGLPDWSDKDKKHLGQELSDVLLYLVDLAERCHVDLPKEVVAKMGVNADKYPAHKVKGSSKKYTEFQ